MRLYYMQGACSLAPHIALIEAGYPFDLMRFDMKTQKLADGTDITRVNEKGYVPVLELDGGEHLTETGVILQYLADHKPESKLAPAPGTMERYRLQEWLLFIATEIHKAYWPLFHDGAEVENQKAREKLGRVFGYLNGKLNGNPFMFGDGFTIVDCYLFVVLNWSRPAGINLEQWPGLFAYRKRIRERPSVHQAMDQEGMIKK